MFMKNVIWVVVILAITINCTSSFKFVKRRSADAPSAVNQQQLDQQQATSGKLKKFYSNKEFVYGQDKDDDDDDDSASSNLLNRFQRTDSHHNSRHNVGGGGGGNRNDALHRNENTLERNLIRNRNKLLGELLDQLEQEQRVEDNNYQLDENLNRFEDEMNPTELKELLKAEQHGPFRQGNDDDDLDEDHMMSNVYNGGKNNQKNQKFAKNNNNNNNHHQKPVNNLNVKENLFLENDYNKQFKSDLNADAMANSQKSPSTEPSSIAINEYPSMINKQNSANPSVVDPNLNSKIESLKKQNDYLFMFVLAGCILAGVVALVAAGVCWYTVNKSYKTDQAEYGVKIGKFNSGSIKSTSSSSGDRRLAQSAQMYHYQHQKQQMIAMEKANNDTKPDNSDNSEGETEEGDYTVYECPGLAPTGEMEVKNPLFREDYSPSSNNIHLSTLPPPPAYSSLTGDQAAAAGSSTPAPATSAETAVNSTAEQQLIQIDSSPVQAPVPSTNPASEQTTTTTPTATSTVLNEQQPTSEASTNENQPSDNKN